VSLGLLTELKQLGVLMLGVLFLVVQGLAINRLAGIDYPIWSPRVLWKNGFRPTGS
jgi:CBS domain-containing membrane protein